MLGNAPLREQYPALYNVPDDEAPVARRVRRRPLHSRPTLNET
jgi:hypothetical protein